MDSLFRVSWLRRSFENHLSRTHLVRGVLWFTVFPELSRKEVCLEPEEVDLIHETNLLFVEFLSGPIKGITFLHLFFSQVSIILWVLAYDWPFFFR